MVGISSGMLLCMQAYGARFDWVNNEAGITFKHERAIFHKDIHNIMPWVTAGGAAVAVVDYDNDGLEDLYFTSSKMGAKNHLYRNIGGFKFSNVADQVGLGDVNATAESGTSSFALWFDFDADGWQDLFLLRFGKTALFRNINGERFKEVTKEAGVFRHTNALSAVAFDYDRDGDLDLYIGGYFPEKDFNDPPDSKVLFDSWETARNGGRNYLFQNKGKGRFTDKTDEAGVHDSGWAMAVGHGDINNDGWQDLYIANDFGTDIVFKNLGGGKFKNISDTAIGVDTKKGMNTEFGDYNNDGLVDVYVTNMTEPYLYECNMLWRNNGNETFTDVSRETGTCDTQWGWGAKFFDADNDADLDLYVANGFISAGENDYMDILLDFIFQEDVDLTDAKQWPDMGGYSMAGYEKNVLFEQTPEGFKSVGASAGVDSVKDARGVAIADFDRDGLLDIAVSNVDAAPDLYRNVSKNDNNWFQIKLRGSSPNRDAIGAKVTVEANGRRQTREVMSSSGFEAQSSLRLHFGLQNANKIERIKILWPDGSVQEFKNIETNGIYTLEQDKQLVRDKV